MKVKVKLRWKIVIPIMIVLVISEVIVYKVVGQSSKNIITEQLADEVSAITHSVTEAIVAKNTKELGSLEKMARFPTIESEEESLYDKQQYVSYVHERCLDPYYEMIIVDKEGKGYSYGGDKLYSYNHLEFVQEGLKGNYYTSTPFNSSSGEIRRLAYSVPVMNTKDEIIGAVFLTVDGFGLCDVLANLVPSENTNIQLIDTNTGFVIAAAIKETADMVENNVNHILDGTIEAGNTEYQKVIKSIMARETGSGVCNVNGQETILAYEPIPDTCWAVLVPAPYSDFSSLMKRQEKNLRITIIISILAICVIGTFIVKGIVYPITEVDNAIADLSSGNADLTKRLTAKTKDEVGSVVDGVNKFTEKLQGIITGLKSSEKELELTGQELDAISEDSANSIVQIIDNIEHVNKQILNQSDSVTETAGAVNEIASNIDSLERMIENQTEGVAQASAAVEQMIGNIGSVNMSVEKMADSFGDLESEAQKGSAKQADVNDKIRLIENQSETLQEANAAIAAIAEQTNLLAMNAAIEAAHAGEAGKGFSVVADEIRKLSETSSAQSKTIGEQLNQIQELILKVVDDSNQSSVSFQNVADRINQTDELVRQIKSAMAEQAAGSKQISSALHEMNDSTTEVRQASKEMAAGNQAILEEVKDLQVASDTIRSSVTVMQDSARKVSDTNNALQDIVKKMSVSISDINHGVNQFKS